MHKADRQFNRELGDKVTELTNELLLRKFTQLDREEVRAMFGLHDLRKSKVWQEAHETGIEKGREEGIEKGKELALRELVRKCRGKGMSVKQIADLMDLPVRDVRRLGR